MSAVNCPNGMSHEPHIWHGLSEPDVDLHCPGVVWVSTPTNVDHRLGRRPDTPFGKLSDADVLDRISSLWRLRLRGRGRDHSMYCLSMSEITAFRNLLAECDRRNIYIHNRGELDNWVAAPNSINNAPEEAPHE